MVQLIANAVVLGCVYALMAVGLNMVYGLQKILHVAHASVYTLGAYVGLLLSLTLTNNLWACLAAAMFASSVFGLFISKLVYQPLLDKPRYISLIASVGVFVAATELFRLVAGPYPYAFSARFAFPAVKTSFVGLTSIQTLVLCFTGAAFFFLYTLVTKTRLGLAWRACIQDMDMAGALGINVNRIVALNFLIGSALAGAAGVLVARYYNRIFPTMGAVVSYKAFVVIVLGGLGSMPGAILAALVLALVESVLGAIPRFEFPRDAIAFLVMTLTLIFRPKGLFGR